MGICKKVCEEAFLFELSDKNKFFITVSLNYREERKKMLDKMVTKIYMEPIDSYRMKKCSYLSKKLMIPKNMYQYHSYVYASVPIAPCIVTYVCANSTGYSYVYDSI